MELLARAPHAAPRPLDDEKRKVMHYAMHDVMHYAMQDDEKRRGEAGSDYGLVAYLGHGVQESVTRLAGSVRDRLVTPKDADEAILRAARQAGHPMG